MKYTEIIKEHLTGISCPVFGLSWNPSVPERKIAQRVIIFLEDRRVLYIPSEIEVPHHCVESVLKIREYITNELPNISRDSELYQSLSAMRIACRKFLDIVDSRDGIIENGDHWNHWASWLFASALGELRGTFGNLIAKISASYGIGIEDELASIVPGSSNLLESRENKE